MASNSIESIKSDLHWKLARLHDSQEHAQIVRLETQVNALRRKLAQAQEKPNG